GASPSRPLTPDPCPMIITIDGPAGAGKSTVAKGLAQRLGFQYLDTGAMYRAIALTGLRARCDLTDEKALATLLENFSLEMPPGRVVVNGEDVTAAIRSAEVDAATGPVASSPVVRRHLAQMQRTLAVGRDIVCEGRDQGTIVFPDAACKFFLVADPVERARRRHRQMLARGEVVALEDVLAAQQARDARDAARDIAPMVPAADAIRLDTSHLSVDQVVDWMEQEVRQCRR
ncbi:MAG TPA: (d)CMP kinase, partial [Gemmataceae bacterium]|nr:(d)CMP kinase [Gemmataceae bacterium]